MIMERVDLTHQHGTIRRRKWGYGSPAGWEYTAVTVGQLADGRWFAQRIGRQADADDIQQGACVFGPDRLGETLAVRLAYRWMTDGEWAPMPPQLDGLGRPTDGLPWIRTGGRWRLQR